VTADPLVLIAEVDRATARLLATARTLDDAAVAAPSPLPGWTRGHVLSHVARNADSLVNVLTGARTGVDTPQYASDEQRDADIEAGAPRPAAVQVADVLDSAGRFAVAVAEMPADAWTVQVPMRGGMRMPAARVVWGRLREVEVHHVDLDAGYRPADWPPAFTHRLLHELVSGWAERPDGPRVRLHATDLDHVSGSQDGPTVSGPAHALAAWLSGRSSGDGLTIDPDGPLPPIPDWR
jgi:maleylpyruvate isomerase